jgi:MFS family permease
MTPITIKLINNYTLEIVPGELHPRYLSTVGLCVAIPVVIGGPLMGWLIRPVGFEIVFLLGAAFLVLAGVMTFRLDEPRNSTSSSAGFDAPRWTK